MQVQNGRFRPDPTLDRDEMEQLQRDIADAATFTDRFAFDPDGPLQVAGVDQAFTEDAAVSGVVVMEGGAVIERVIAETPLAVPYIPGLLAFREGGSIIAALEQLDTVPDLFLFDGSGRIHFREAGLATHMGVLFDVPSVGVAKNLLCGAPERPLDGPLETGARVAIMADDRVATVEQGTVIGYVYQSKQYPDPETRHVNPLYVSPGHRVSADTAVTLLERFCDGYKLPDPVRLADRYVSTATT